MKVGEITNIKIVINDLFLLVLIAYFFLGVLPQAAVIFTVVLWHEIAHIIAARQAGIRTWEVELFPFGGVAKMEFMEADPAVETGIALAGPMSNFFMVGVGLLLYHYFPFNRLLAFFIQTNVLIGLFNLLPGLPLDGGRVFRSYSTRKEGYREATEKAIRNGKYVACILLVLGAIGLYFQLTDLNPVLIAVFLYVAADKERNTVAYRFIRYLTKKEKFLKQNPVLEVHHLAAYTETQLKDILPRLLPDKFQTVLILGYDGQISGTLTEFQIINGYFRYGEYYPVGELQKRL